MNHWSPTGLNSISMNKVDLNLTNLLNELFFYHSMVEDNPGFNLFVFQRILFQMLNPDRTKRFVGLRWISLRMVNGLCMVYEIHGMNHELLQNRFQF